MENPASPEANVLHRPELALAEENIDLLRARQQEILQDPDMFDEQKQAAIDETVRDYLGSHGVEQDEDSYITQYDSIRSFSADQMSYIKWRYGDWDNDTKTLSGKTGYDKLHDLQLQLLGRRLDFGPNDSDADTNDASDATPENERTSELQTNLMSARTAWAEASAQRSSKFFGKKNDKHEAVEAQYQAALQAYGKNVLSDELASDELSEEEKNVAVVTYLFDEQEQLREQITANINGTKVGRFVRFMNTGTKKERIGKGIALGIGAGLIGSFLAGAAGAGVIAAGTVAAARFVRGYAQHDKRGVLATEDHFDRGAVAEVMTDERSSLTSAERGDRFDDADRHFSYLLEDQTIDQQKKRRAALAWGAGSVALGATVGWGLHAATEWSAGRNLQVVSGDNWDKFKDWVNDDFSVGSPENPIDSDRPDMDTDGVPNFKDSDIDNDGVNNADDIAPRNPNIQDMGDKIDKLEWSDFNADAHLVEAGEGWYQTFGELGIPEHLHQEILTDVGPELEDQGWAYYDGAAKEWRISHQGDLTPEVLQTIAKSAERGNFTLAA